MTDIHSHTRFSPDSIEEAENVVLQALKIGCQILGFSEHLDYDYVVNKLDVILTDVDSYCKNTAALKQKYSGKIKILCGIEIGYHSMAEDYYTEVFKRYNFDYVINSTHIAAGKDCYFKPYFEGKTKETAYTQYFQALRESVYAGIDYQIIGHIGYVIRNAPYADKTLYYEEYSHYIDDILKGIIEREKVLEINTNISGHGTPTLPMYSIIKRYYEMGGRLFSYGSDCHKVSRLCDGYNTVTNMLKDLNIKEIAYFENKQIKFYAI